MNEIFELDIKTVIEFVIEGVICSIIAFWTRRENKKFEERWDRSRYELRMPKYIFWFGVICAVLCFLPVILVPGTGNETFPPQVAALFIGFSLFGALLTAYASQWRIIVQYDKLVVRVPFKAIREISISDITVMRKLGGGIVLYLGAKKVIAIDHEVIGYRELCTKLQKAGKMA